ncbi:MAG: serine--tRNA ligase, partial [Patescibacteria group bacterium]
MLDIKFIRDNADLVRLAATKKKVKFDLDRLLKLDDERLEFLRAIETARAEQNVVGEKIAKASATDKATLIADMTTVKEKLKGTEESMATVMKEWQTLMLQVPNIPDISVPEGQDESENVEAYTWGKKPKFDFPAKDHIELMTALGMVDLERGTKVHGFRGYFLQGAGAEWSWALFNYARDFFGRKNFVPFIAPAIVKKEYFYGTGHLPREAEDLYKTQDDDYLSGTAEVPMMAYHGDEILTEAELPKRYLAFSPCYRREAGSHGKDTKGLIRVHEFFKLEQLIICRADHNQSVELHEEINRNYEEFLETLKLAHRRLVICGGDLSLGKVKQYDTEVWFPSQEAYREGSSASYYHDFQT